MKLTENNTTILRRLLKSRSSRPLRSLLLKLDPAETAKLFGILNKRETEVLIEALIAMERLVQVLAELPSLQLEVIFSQLRPDQRHHVLANSEPPEAAKFLASLPPEIQVELLHSLPSDRANRIRQFLDYPDESAGRLMSTHFFSLPVNCTANEGIEVLRSKAQQESIYYIYCTDSDNHLVGIISLRQLATAPASKTLKEFVKTDVIAVPPTAHQNEVARIVANYNFIALPVIDENRRLLGIITIDDVVDIIQDQASANLYAQAGLQEDDRVYTPASQSIRHRLPWMYLNLFLAAIASTVVSFFESTMHEIILLASLKNIVAGMGGNTAIQSLTVVTRGLATGDFSFISRTRAFLKELITGLTIGLIMGVSSGLLIYVWKGDKMVSVVICLSMIINSLIAASAGSLIPLALQRLGRDPATGSGVLVTMLCDIFSFFSFLGIAALGLKYFT